MLEHVQREYRLNRIFLSWLGIWPFQNKHAKRFLQFYYLTVNVTYFPLVVIMIYYHWSDGEILFEGCYQVVLLTIFVGKMVNEIWNHDKIRNLYQAMNDHWNIFTNESEIRILKNYAVASRKFTIFYSMYGEENLVAAVRCLIKYGTILILVGITRFLFDITRNLVNFTKILVTATRIIVPYFTEYLITLMYVMVILFLSIPLMPIFLDHIRPFNESRPRVFAVVTEIPLDKDKYFVIIYYYHINIIGLGTMIMVSIDTMYVAFTAHACSLFRIVNRQFEEVTSRLNSDETNSERDHSAMFDMLNERTLHERYIACLKKHQLVIKFVNTFNSAYQMIALLLLLLNGATISLVGVRIVYILDQIKETIRYTFVIMAMLMQLLILCYSSQKLIDESQGVFHRAYAMEWYGFSPRVKSLLVITLHRGIVPCSLTAGKMVPLSMLTYATVVRTAMSYFMTFLSLKK